MFSFLFIVGSCLIAIVGIAIMNMAMVGMAKEVNKDLPPHVGRFRWYQVLGSRSGGSRDSEVSGLYRKRFGKDAKYNKFLSNGWRMFLAGLPGLAYGILSNMSSRSR